MNAQDKLRLIDVLTAAFSIYPNVKLTPMATELWLAALDPFDIRAVQEALSAHVRNPDVGQYPPKPADVVRHLQGASGESAAWAWAKVDRAARTVGGYASVAFDDPAIHLAIEGLGGWCWLCEQPERELPFIAKRFETLYASARQRGTSGQHPAYLIGRTEADNRSNGHHRKNVLIAIGDQFEAERVMATGRTGPPLQLAEHRAPTPAHLALPTGGPNHA